MSLLPNFKKFVIESLEDDELVSLGLGTNTAQAVYDAIMAKEPGDPLEDYLQEPTGGNTLTFSIDWVQDLDELEHLGVDPKEYRRQAQGITLDRAFGGTIDIDMNFDTLQFEVSVSVEQLDMNWNESYDENMEMLSILDIEDKPNPTADDYAEALIQTFTVFYGQEDPFGVWGIIEDSEKEALELHKSQNQENSEDDEDYDEDDYNNDEELDEKKRLKWHDSDAPDANGKFKELGVHKLADWLIKTRGSNMQKITGSLNQQINFNKKKNPSYAKKME